MRASDRLRQFEAQEGGASFLRGLQTPAFVLIQALFVLGILFLISLLECDDPSTVDDSIIPFALVLLGLLGAVLLGLLLAGAPPLPCASALLPPLVIFALPWRDVHSAAALTWAWLAVHVCVLGWTLFRRPTSRSKRRGTR